MSIVVDTFVKKSVVVNAPVAHAFKIFTERFDLWWPKSHHIGKAEMQTAIVEKREGGRWYERGVDGSECDWGKVIVYSPPTRVALSWHLTKDFAYDPNPSTASRVEVTFHDEGGGRTRVELVHSELDRHGEGWQHLRERVSAPGGWSDLLAALAAAVAHNGGAVSASP